MKRLISGVAVAALLPVTASIAQPATYDPAGGILTLPSVSVAGTTYGSVRLLNVGNYTFTLQMAYGVAPLANAEGIWRGAGGASLVTGVVLDSGAYYFFHSAPGNPTKIGGFVQGSSTSSNGIFSSSDAKDFSFEEQEIMSLGALNGSYLTRQWLIGTATDPGGASETFGMFFDFDYDAVPSLAVLAGTYSGQASFGPPFGSANLSVTLGAGGAISGVFESCSFAGSATPRSRGTLYDLNINFGAGCEFPGQTFSGIIFLDSRTGRLMAAGLNAQRTGAGLFVASK